MFSYVKHNENADKLRLVSKPLTTTDLGLYMFVQLRDAASGLAYLHHEGVVHGNGKFCPHVLRVTVIAENPVPSTMCKCTNGSLIKAVVDWRQKSNILVSSGTVRLDRCS